MGAGHFFSLKSNIYAGSSVPPTLPADAISIKHHVLAQLFHNIKLSNQLEKT